MSSAPGPSWKSRFTRPGGVRQAGRALLLTVLCLAALSAAAVLAAVKLRRQKASALLSLSVRSQPFPAEVRLDGRFVGLTPLEVREVAAGEHLVGVSLEGYQPYSRLHLLRPAQGTVSVRLERQPAGGLLVRSEPEGAEVIIEGQSRGNTPLELTGLAPGSYRVMLRKAGYEFWSDQLAVEAGKRAEVSAKLENSVLRFLTAAVEANPKDLHYWTELGHYLGCHDRDEESLEAFKKGLELCLQAGVDSGEVQRHFQMLARQMHWPGKPRAEYCRKVGIFFVELSQKHSGDPKAVARLAHMLERARRYNEALKLYLGACRRNKGSDASLVIRGFSLATRLKQTDTAAEIAKLARSGRPRDHSVRLQLGDLCLQSYGRYTGAQRTRLLAMAEELYAEAADLATSSHYKSRACYGLARALNFAGKHAKAADAYGRAADHLAAAKGSRSKWAEWLFERANLLVKVGRKQDARGVLTRIVSEGPEGSVRERARQELKRLGPEPQK